MADIEKLRRNLERLGYMTSYFKTAEECVDYLDACIDNATVGFGGSQTIREIELYDRLQSHNACAWHWDKKNDVISSLATHAQVYICSVNGVSENGELVNIDGGGNRLASNLFGHEMVYFVIGRNKIAADYEAALWRARNIAAPLNAKRLGAKTPCAALGHCVDCKSPERICSALLVYWKKPTLAGKIEIVIVDQDLGF